MTVSRITMTKEGPELSRMAAGFWRLMEWGYSRDELLSLIDALLDRGVTTMDHADLYGGFQCEAAFGEALAARPGLRERMEIVTKCGIRYPCEARPNYRLQSYDTGQAHITASVENSLGNFHTDYIDLLLIHRPDPMMDADETAAAFSALRRAGKVRFFGVSNFTPSQFELLQSRLDFPLVTNQIEFSALHPDPLYDGTLDQLQRLRVAPQAWSPFGGGRIFTADTEQVRRVRDALGRVGEELGGAPVDQVALAWILMHPARFQIMLGSGKLARLESALAAESLTLTREQWFIILEAANGHPVP